MERIFRIRVPASSFSDSQICALLRALVAKAGLTYEETVGAFATRKRRCSNDLLAVHRDGANSRFRCGENPHFVAWLDAGANKASNG